MLSLAFSASAVCCFQQARHSLYQFYKTILYIYIKYIGNVIQNDPYNTIMYRACTKNQDAYACMHMHVHPIPQGIYAIAPPPTTQSLHLYQEEEDHPEGEFDGEEEEDHPEGEFDGEEEEDHPEGEFDGEEEEDHPEGEFDGEEEEDHPEGEFDGEEEEDHPEGETKIPIGWYKVHTHVPLGITVCQFVILLLLLSWKNNNIYLLYEEDEDPSTWVQK